MILTIGDSHTAGMHHILQDMPDYLKNYKNLKYIFILNKTFCNFIHLI